MNNSIENELITNGFVISAFSGASMRPLLNNERGDKVYIVKYNGKGLKKGDIALYKRRDGQLVLHRVMRLGLNDYAFSGDNHMVYEYGIKDGDVLGVMQGYYKGEKYIDLKKSIKYKFYKATYGRSFFLRKVLKKLKLVK